MKGRRVNPIAPLVGFDYAKATLELLAVYSYETVAEAIGYKSNASITRLLEGQVPPHVQGEALWSLYIQTFDRKPPMK